MPVMAEKTGFAAGTLGLPDLKISGSATPGGMRATIAGSAWFAAGPQEKAMLHAVNANARAAARSARHQEQHAALLEEKRRRLLAIIREKSFLTKGGPFKLASGGMSDFYLDMKPTTFSPEGLNLIADILYDMIR